MINTLDTFHAFSAGALWLLGTLLLLGVNRTNKRSESWLAAFHYLMAALFTQLFLEGMYFRNEAVLFVLELPRWAILPCLYLAISYMTTPGSSTRHWALHFIPFLAFLLFSIVYLMPSFFNMEIPPLRLPSWIVFLIKYFFLAQSIFYWIACYLLLKKHQKNIRQLSSYTERIDLAWVGYLLMAMLLLILIRGLAITLPAVHGLSPILYFIGTIALAYFSLTQRSIYATESSENLIYERQRQQSKYEERLSPQQLELLKTEVLARTISEKIYLDPNLTLSILSEHVGINSHDLSYILNNGLNKSFYQYINELRTEEAKRLLLSDEARLLDMSGIAIRAGFNSRTTFYNSFKKITGVTPKEYMKGAGSCKP